MSLSRPRFCHSVPVATSRKYVIHSVIMKNAGTTSTDIPASTINGGCTTYEVSLNPACMDLPGGGKIRKGVGSRCDASFVPIFPIRQMGPTRGEIVRERNLLARKIVCDHILYCGILPPATYITEQREHPRVFIYASLLQCLLPINNMKCTSLLLVSTYLIASFTPTDAAAKLCEVCVHSETSICIDACKPRSYFSI